MEDYYTLVVSESSMVRASHARFLINSLRLSVVEKTVWVEINHEWHLLSLFYFPFSFLFCFEIIPRNVDQQTITFLKVEFFRSLEAFMIYCFIFLMFKRTKEFLLLSYKAIKIFRKKILYA